MKKQDLVPKLTREIRELEEKIRQWEADKREAMSDVESAKGECYRFEKKLYEKLKQIVEWDIQVHHMEGDRDYDPYEYGFSSYQSKSGRRLSRMVPWRSPGGNVGIVESVYPFNLKRD